MLSVFKLNIIIFSVIMLIDIISSSNAPNFIILRALMLSIVMMSIILPSVIMLNVMAPLFVDGKTKRQEGDKVKV